MNYRYEQDNEEFRIVEIRENNEELVVFKTTVEKRAKELYRKMKRGQCGFNGWTPNFILT